MEKQRGKVDGLGPPALRPCKCFVRNHREFILLAITIILAIDAFVIRLI